MRFDGQRRPTEAARSDAHDAPNPLERPFHWLAGAVPRFRLRASLSCPSKRYFYYLFKLYGPLVSRHRSDVVGCAQQSERSARRIAQPIPSVLSSDATPRCASMASADRQMIGDATLDFATAERMNAAPLLTSSERWPH